MIRCCLPAPLPAHPRRSNRRQRSADGLDTIRATPTGTTENDAHECPGHSCSSPPTTPPMSPPTAAGRCTTSNRCSRPYRAQTSAPDTEHCQRQTRHLRHRAFLRASFCAAQPGQGGRVAAAQVKRRHGVVEVGRVQGVVRRVDHARLRACRVADDTGVGREISEDSVHVSGFVQAWGRTAVPLWSGAGLKHDWAAPKSCNGFHSPFSSSERALAAALGISNSARSNCLLTTAPREAETTAESAALRRARRGWWLCSWSRRARPQGPRANPTGHCAGSRPRE
jgi:hypothetical protein